MQNDGNLVVYDTTGKATWNSGTSLVGTSPFVLSMQNDGNLVIYDTNGVATWNTGTK
jgi:hypothetical protein